MDANIAGRDHGRPADGHEEGLRPGVTFVKHMGAKTRAGHELLYVTGWLPLPQADPYLWPFDGQLRKENTALLSINFQKSVFDPEGDFAKSNMQDHRHAGVLIHPFNRSVVRRCSRSLQKCYR